MCESRNAFAGMTEGRGFAALHWLLAGHALSLGNLVGCLLKPGDTADIVSRADAIRRRKQDVEVIAVVGELGFGDRESVFIVPLVV